MSFEKLFKDDLTSKDFGKERYKMDYKSRSNVSKSVLDTDTNVTYLEKNSNRAGRYDGPMSARYVSALNLSYDFIVSFFNINTRDSLVCRTYKPDVATNSMLVKYLNSMRMKRPNIEARIIGMQNGQEYSRLYDIAELIASRKIQLVEVDLFGTDVRHVAFDTKLGMSFEVLAEDRIYKPGELKNNMTLEQFERSLTQGQQPKGVSQPRISMPTLG